MLPNGPVIGPSDAVVGAVPHRSPFVTVLAWVFIVLAGFACFVGVLQALALIFIMPPPKFWSDPGTARGLEQMQPVARF